MMNNKVIIIGGGASGMVAAIQAKKNGNDVTIFEANKKPGRKILVTGNGHCNLTNKDIKPDMFYSDDMTFIKELLKRFSYKDTLSFFNSIGLLTREKKNLIYPMSNQARSVVEALESQCHILGVKFIHKHVKSIEKIQKHMFSIKTDDGMMHSCDKLIIACGSAAGNKEYSNEGIIDYIKKTGHDYKTMVPALCGLCCDEKSFFSKVKGIRSDVKVSVLINDEEIKIPHNDTEGELQLTEYGLSGIVIFQISSIVSRALRNNNKVTVFVDFLPDFEDVVVIANLLLSQDYAAKKNLMDINRGILNEDLAKELVIRYAEEINRKDLTISKKNITAAELISFLSYLKSVKFEISKVNPSNAQIYTGGVSTKDINPLTMESKRVSGLYIIGEMLNAEGICGGYNLQLAWSEGYIAGGSIRL